MSRTLVTRAFLSLLLLLLLFAACIYELTSSILLGQVRAPLRGWSDILFTYSHDPIEYAIAIGLWAAAAGGFAWLAIRQIRALVQPRRPENVAMLQAQGRELERLNPTGFLPLWVALAIALFVALYAFAAA